MARTPQMPAVLFPIKDLDIQLNHLKFGKNWQNLQSMPEGKPAQILQAKKQRT
jgi:hypothetical protein